MTEQLALDQLLGDRRAVDLDEGLVLAERVAVDGASDQLLAGAALAGDQHRGVRRRGPAHRVPHLLERRAAAHHPVALVENQPQTPVLLHQTFLPERVAGGDQDALALRRLLDEVEGAELDGLDGGLDGAVAGEDHDRRRAVARLQPFEHLEAVQLGHLDVEEHEVRALLLGELEPDGAVGGQQHLVALVFEDHAQRGTDRVFVVDDQNPRLHGRFSTSMRVRKEPRDSRGRGR